MAGATVAGCAVDTPRGERTEAAGQAATEAGGWSDKVLAWGNAEGQVGLRPAAMELPAEGPSALAMAASGDVLVLDRLNERVIAISPSGAIRTAGAVARDAEHLATATDGAFAAWSPLRATVSVTGRDGAAQGEVAVPRVFRDIQQIGLEPSHRVIAITAMQETLQLGSPRAPLDLAESLRSKREGAAFLGDGRSIAARRSENGAGEILVYRKPVANADSKPPVSWTYTISAPVSAVRVVGVSGNTICARVERVTQATALAVEREALCVDVDTGVVRLKHALGRPGLYAPHQDVAVGSGVLTVMRPEEGGLRLERLSLSTGATSATEVAQ